MRRTRLRPVSRRRAKSTERMHDVRAVLEKRSRGYCEVGGELLPVADDGGYEAQHHHRQLRKRGGEDTPENGLLCCFRHHGQVHLEPEFSTQMGWIVASWDDPAVQPVWYGSNGPALLLPDGTVQAVPSAPGIPVRMGDLASTLLADLAGIRAKELLKGDRDG